MSRTGGRSSAADAVDGALAAVAADGRDGIWIDLVDPAAARRRAAEVDRRVAAGEHLPLAGTTLAVKGNIDVAGLPTTAGCPGFATGPAPGSAVVVRALEDAGAVVVGTTNLDQFATGLVGTRSPYGACPNALVPGLVSGGSSSGSAVAVASGLVDLALGTDTAGSGRVPAAANGIVGVKPTRGRLSTQGVVPACASLDCVSVFARDVRLADLAVQVAATGADGAGGDPWRRTPPPGPAPRPIGGPVRLGLPEPAALDFDGDPRGPSRHLAARSALVGALPGTAPVDVGGDALADLVAAGRLLYEGAFVAERYAAVGAFVDAHPDVVDPVVGPIIRAAGRLPAWRLAADLTTLAAHRRRSDALFDGVDVLVLPSVPRIPTVAEVRAEPLAVNAALGTYTNFVNLLDLCAVTFPVPAEDRTDDGPPPSITLVAPAWCDDLLVSLAAAVPGGGASPWTG